VSQIMLAFGAHQKQVLLGALALFFAAFNIMEASLPSLVTKTAPPGATGTATGVYSSSQFMGIFVGGAVGGLIEQHGGTGAVFAFATVIALIWLGLAATMRAPSYLTSRVVRLAAQVCDAQSLAAALRAVPGVAEAIVVAEEGVAYLKVDARRYDPSAAATVAGAPLQSSD
jgi:MFS family permease